MISPTNPTGPASATAVVDPEQDGPLHHDEDQRPGVARPAVATTGSVTPAPVVAPSRATPPAAPVAAPTIIELPSSGVEPDRTRVVFPAYAKGHRIWVDGRMLPTASAPTKLRCGKHTIKIGSAGRARALELPCSRELMLD